jgi:hypothetical protein
MKHNTDLWTALESIEDLLEKAEFISQAYNLTELGIGQVRERLLLIAEQHLKT